MTLGGVPRGHIGVRRDVERLIIGRIWRRSGVVVCRPPSGRAGVVIHYRAECMDLYTDSIRQRINALLKMQNVEKQKRKKRQTLKQKRQKQKSKHHLYCTGYLTKPRNQQADGSRTVTGVWVSVGERRGEKRVLTARAFERCGANTVDEFWKRLDPAGRIQGMNEFRRGVNRSVRMGLKVGSLDDNQTSTCRHRR